MTLKRFVCEFVSQNFCDAGQDEDRQEAHEHERIFRKHESLSNRTYSMFNLSSNLIFYGLR